MKISQAEGDNKQQQQQQKWQSQQRSFLTLFFL